MPSYALAAVGRDRPGIVAAIAKVLYEQGCNVEDSSMTLLRGNFAVMLILAAPEGLSEKELTDALRPACEELGLLFDVLPVTDVQETPHPSHILTVYGADKPGILFRMTEALAASGVNITDLNSRLIGEASHPVYALMLELALPADGDAARLETVLRQLAAQLGVDMTLRPMDEDIL